MLRLLPRLTLLARKRLFLQLPEARYRSLNILHLPKDGSLSLPISVEVNRNNDIIHRFVKDGIEAETLTFAEEPMGLTAEQGLGYLQLDLGERFGPSGRFEILRKLGYGNNSSVWLAKDVKDNKFVAIKALTAYATNLCKRGFLLEHDILRTITRDRDPSKLHCLTMIGRFVVQGKDGEGSEHLCLVTDPMGPDVRQVLRSQSEIYRKPLIKKILRDTLIGLKHLHSLGIAHTDLFDRNIMVDLGSGPNIFDIASFIEKEPSRKNPPERTWGGKWIQTAVSQPFPVPSDEEALTRNFVIADLGSAQYVDRKSTDRIMPLALRAPEVILRLPWDERVDIWAFGCLVFELIHKRTLIDLELMDRGVPYETAVLSQMVVTSGDRLSPETIQSSVAAEIFDPQTSWLIGRSEIPEVRLLDILKRIGVLTNEEDLLGVHDLLRKCIRLNPQDRLAARDLLEDPWLNSKT